MSFEGRPHPEHAPAYARLYFEKTAGETHLLDALRNNKADIAAFIRSIPDNKVNFQYAEGKWTLKGVISHMIDTERIFQNRALRFSRKDTTVVPGFDENFYALHDNNLPRSMEDMALEFESVRESGIHLFSHMTDDMLDFVGQANNNPLSARSAGWIIVGHAIHHRTIIEQRYLSVETI